MVSKSESYEWRKFLAIDDGKVLRKHITDPISEPRDIQEGTFTSYLFNVEDKEKIPRKEDLCKTFPVSEIRSLKDKNVSYLKPRNFATNDRNSGEPNADNINPEDNPTPLEVRLFEFPKNHTQHLKDFLEVAGSENILKFSESLQEEVCSEHFLDGLTGSEKPANGVRVRGDWPNEVKENTNYFEEANSVVLVALPILARNPYNSDNPEDELWAQVRILFLRSEVIAIFFSGPETQILRPIPPPRQRDVNGYEFFIQLLLSTIKNSEEEYRVDEFISEMVNEADSLIDKMDNRLLSSFSSTVTSACEAMEYAKEDINQARTIIKDKRLANIMKIRKQQIYILNNLLQTFGRTCSLGDASNSSSEDAFLVSSGEKLDIPHISDFPESMVANCLRLRKGIKLLEEKIVDTERRIKDIEKSCGKILKLYIMEFSARAQIERAERRERTIGSRDVPKTDSPGQVETDAGSTASSHSLPKRRDQGSPSREPLDERHSSQFEKSVEDVLVILRELRGALHQNGNHLLAQTRLLTALMEGNKTAQTSAKVEQDTLQLLLDASRDSGYFLGELVAESAYQGELYTFFTAVTSVFFPLAFFSAYYALELKSGEALINTESEFWAITGPVVSLFFLVIFLVIALKKYKKSDILEYFGRLQSYIYRKYILQKRCKCESPRRPESKNSRDSSGSKNSQHRKCTEPNCTRTRPKLLTRAENEIKKAKEERKRKRKEALAEDAPKKRFDEITERSRLTSELNAKVVRSASGASPSTRNITFEGSDGAFGEHRDDVDLRIRVCGGLSHDENITLGIKAPSKLVYISSDSPIEPEEGPISAGKFKSHEIISSGGTSGDSHEATRERENENWGGGRSGSRSAGVQEIEAGKLEASGGDKYKGKQPQRVDSEGNGLLREGAIQGKVKGSSIKFSENGKGKSERGNFGGSSSKSENPEDGTVALQKVSVESV